MSKYFVAVFLVFTVVALAAAQSKTVSKQQSPQPLTLTARTDRQVYRMSEEITMETRLLNAGREDVYVWDWDFCWNLARGLSMYITEKKGSPVRSSFWLDCLPPPAQKGDVYQFIRLKPHEFHGSLDKFKVKDFINKPGEYDMQITFNSFISDSYIQEFLASDPIAKLPVWTMEKPTVEASPVHIVVTP